jgi:DNA-binding response OmpR family regulator/S1-C subfamily serine protease
VDQSPETIAIVAENPAVRGALQASLESAGYAVAAFATPAEALDAIHHSHLDVLLLDTDVSGAASSVPAGAPPSDPVSSAHELVAAIHGSAATQGIRIILLVNASAEERGAALDLGADDALSRPWDSAELLARLRTQLRVRRAERELLEKVHIAEEGQQIAHTAFEALAVTEKMTSNAVSLDRGLKIGFSAILILAIVMGGIYFLFVHSAQKQTQRVNAVIARLDGGILSHQVLMSQARKLRETQPDLAADPPGKEELRKQSEDLKAKMATANADEVATLKQQLADTDARLKRVEQQGDAAQSLIPADVQSVCLLHVAVAFRNMANGQRLRYAGLNPQGEPLQDSEGNPIFTLDGPGPEVKLDVFGTGFVAGADGKVITNRHVAEPWWNDDDLKALTDQGFQAEISTIRAYFPGDPRAFSAEIQDISKSTDLATMRVNMKDLKRPVLSVDSTKEAALPGQPIILMGYATGLAAILARTDDDTAQKIMSQSDGDISQVMDEIAKRGLIRPIITQGHIGDVLPDKIVFDAQTTSGGSGGPLFNRQGKVIGVTYAVLKGFGGSNFGIPIRLSQPLLGPQP